MKQLSLKLDPLEPYSLRYFVAHSGVSEAVSVLERAIEQAAAQPESFTSVLVYGAKGTGKTHLIEGYYTKALSCGVRGSQIYRCDLRSSDYHKSEDSLAIGQFISKYQDLKRAGGVVLAEGADSVLESLNPHLRSRLCSGYMVRVGYPREEELKPLLSSLLERKNLRLSEYSINYLLRWLPLDPLSFDSILSAINELSFSQNRRAGWGVVQEAVRGKR